MTPSPARPARAIAISPDRAVSTAARTGAFALPFLALVLATFESAFVTVAQQVAIVARHYVWMP